MRSFATEVVLSLTTGRLLCPFSDLHEFVEFVAGEPVFTHQLAHRAFVQELKDGVFRQYPQLKAIDESGVTKDNWQEFRDKYVEALGPTLDISPLAIVREAERSFTEPLEGKNVIVVAPHLTTEPPQ